MASFGAFQSNTLSRPMDFALGRQYKTPPAAAVLIAGEVYDQVVGTYAAPYTAAANVRSGTDRGDGVLGEMVSPEAINVRQGIIYDVATIGTLLARPVPAPTAAVLLLPPPAPLAAGYYNPNPAPPTPRGFRYV